MSVWNERQFYTGNPVHSSFQTKRNLSLVQIAVLQREFTWAAYLIYEQNGFDAKFIHFSNWYFDNRSVFVACLLDLRCFGSDQLVLTLGNSMRWWQCSSRYILINSTKHQEKFCFFKRIILLSKMRHVSPSLY